MPGKRIDPRRAKKHRAYSVGEAALLLDVHKNTVRKMIKDGLPVVDDMRPTLIRGGDLRAWLEKRREANKQPCPPGTIYCVKCRQPRPPALGMVEYEARNGQSGQLKAICAVCETMMHRAARQSSLAAIMPDLDVRITQAPPRVGEPTNPSLNCDKAMEA